MAATKYLPKNISYKADCSKINLINESCIANNVIAIMIKIIPLELLSAAIKVIE
jgi:hypothetical protein